MANIETLLRKYFKEVEKFEGTGNGDLSGYSLSGLIGFDNLDTNVVLVQEDYLFGEFSLEDAFLDYAHSTWDYIEHEDSDMRNESARKKILEIAGEIEYTVCLI